MNTGASITIQEYWRRVLALAATLPEIVTVVSVPDMRLNENQRGGVVFCEVVAKTAAQLILAGSHRLAQPDEITKQETKRQTDILEKVRQSLASRGIVSITLPEQSLSK